MPAAIDASIAGHAFRGAGDLDHQVRPVDVGPQPLRRVDRPLRVVREVRRDFERDVAVEPLRLFPDRMEQVAGAADVADRERLEHRASDRARRSAFAAARRSRSPSRSPSRRSSGSTSSRAGRGRSDAAARPRRTCCAGCCRARCSVRRSASSAQLLCHECALLLSQTLVTGRRRRRRRAQV